MKITRHPMSSFDFGFGKGKFYFRLPGKRGGYIFWFKEPA